MCFANKVMACLDKEIVKVTQEREFSVSKAELLVLEAQSVSGQAEEVKKLHERVLSFETAARVMIAKGS